MAENTKIEWAHHTVNFWAGCQKVSPACEHCYAEGWDHHYRPGGETHWGPNAPRLHRLQSAVIEAKRYQRRAEREGVRYRVFTNSLSDFFEDRRELDATRAGALEVIRLTPNLDWMLLTKRPECIIDLLIRAFNDAPGPSEFTTWLGGWIAGNRVPRNVWLGTTVESQEWADKRIPALLQVPAAVRFLSVEPMLGPIELDPWLKVCKHWRTEDSIQQAPWHPAYPKHWYEPQALVLADWKCPIDWVICGGESGAHARPMHPNWPRSLRDQCAAAGVPFILKQWGEYVPEDQEQHPEDGQPRRSWRLCPWPGDKTSVAKVGKHAAGRTLDGIIHDGYPEAHHG